MSKQTRSRLTQADFFELCQWVKENKESILKRRPAFTELADEATLKKGMTMERRFTPEQLSRACKVLKISWSPVSDASKNLNIVISRHNTRILANMVYHLACVVGDLTGDRQLTDEFDQFVAKLNDNHDETNQTDND